MSKVLKLLSVTTSRLTDLSVPSTSMHRTLSSLTWTAPHFMTGPMLL